MTKPDHHDTAEHLLSPEAIERALDGRASEEKAKAFRAYLDDNPEARAALEGVREQRETANLRHTGLERLHSARQQADQGGVALEPEPQLPQTTKERNLLPFATVLLLAAVGLLVFAILRATNGSRDVVTASPSATSTEEVATTEPPSLPSVPATEEPTATPPVPSSEPTAAESSAKTHAQPPSPATVAPVETGKPASTAKPQPPPSSAPTSTSKLIFPDEPQ